MVSQHTANFGFVASFKRQIRRCASKKNRPAINADLPYGGGMPQSRPRHFCRPGNQARQIGAIGAIGAIGPKPMTLIEALLSVVRPEC